MSKNELKKILILSTWENLWSLGEGCGVPDELHFSEGLHSNGVEISFLKPESAGHSERFKQTGITKYTYPNIVSSFERLPGPIARFLISAYFPYKITHRLQSLAAMINPDLILGFAHQPIHPISEVGRKLGIPTAIKLFGVMQLGRDELPRSKYWYYNFDQINSLRYPVDHYIVLNDGTLGKKALVNRGIPENKISFLQNGMNLKWAEMKIDRSEVRRAMGLPENDILVVALSRLIKLKRIGHLLKAAARISKETIKSVSFVIVGDGSRKKYLIRKSRALGLEKRVHFTGAVPYKQVPELLKACDIFAGTSELTNMSMPTCEAMLCGLPIIAYDIAGTSEVVRDGETGLLVENSNIDSFARKLSLLIKDKSLRQRLAKEAAAFSKEYFVDWDHRVEQEMEILKTVVENYRT